MVFSSSSVASSNAVQINVNKNLVNYKVSNSSSDNNITINMSSNLSYIEKYHSEDDDNNIVTLRSKHNAIEDNDQQQNITLSRSFSFPNNTNKITNNNHQLNINRKSDINTNTNDKNNTNNGLHDKINNIERIRSFLESEYIPHELWHLQRDSFIHRNYNEKHLSQINNNNNNNNNLSSKDQHTDDQLSHDDNDYFAERPKTIHITTPATSSSAVVTFKRDSFLHKSINNIRRSFNKSIKRKNIERRFTAVTNKIGMDSNHSDKESNNNYTSDDKDNDEYAVENINNNNNNSDNNVSDNTNSDNNINSDNNNNNINSDNDNNNNNNNNSKNLILNNTTKKHGHSRNSSSSSCLSNRSTHSVGFRSAPSSPMAPLQGQTEPHEQINLNSLSRSPSHNSTKIESKSVKQLSNTPVVATTNARTPSPHPTKSSKNDIPEKEKKRKESSSGRQKKFHRHFQQVATDERVINYFSCALVSDILLQGHLYITDNYFAFYSNVFGFVTKLLIPIISVVKISKEKTAKIIPNAVGVATADERHVFGSFMSREAAYRLMLSVWRPLATPIQEAEIENIPKIPDVEISECSIEDDSSSAISGNESPPQINDSTTSDGKSDTIRYRNPMSSAAISALDSSGGGGVGLNGEHNSSSNASGDIINDIPLISNNTETINNFTQSSHLTTAITTTTNTNNNNLSSSSSSPKFINNTSRYIKLKFPTNFHIVYLGVFFVIILSILSGYLLYRILDIQAKTNQFSPLDFKWDENQDVDVYADVLKWQKQMQSKSVDEAQIILNSNLEQIAKVRKSLETLSILIHDKNAPNLPDTSENYVSDEDSPL